MQVSFGQLRITRLRAVPRRFRRWWLREFLHLFPERIAEGLVGRGRAKLVISGDGQDVTLELLGGGQTPIASERVSPRNGGSDDISRFLDTQKIRRNEVEIGLRLPAEAVFCRQLLLPAEAIDAIEVIVAQDLARKTPFKPEDIYSDRVVIESDQDNRITVWQWITRRKLVEQAVLQLGLDIEQFAFVVFDHVATGHPAPCISLRRSVLARTSWWNTTVLGLCFSAVVLALVAGGLKYWNQQTLLDRLAADTAVAGKKAQRVRALVDQLQEHKTALLRLRLQRTETPGLIDLWQETTRVLPSHSWLTEFRLAEVAGTREEQVVTLLGFSNAAPSLVGIIDGSPLFFDAGLTAPIALDPTEGRERFAVQAKVKMPIGKESLR